LIFDPYSNQFRAIVTLLDGDMKIRANEAWDVAYGDVNSDGVLDQENDNNIAVTAGIYIVTVNFNDLSYSLEEIDYVWGVVGSGYNDWGATPDAKFTRDWSTNDDVWILNGVTLLDGEIKFRANEAWDVAYGDLEPDGVLDQENDNNIAVTAGTYNITLDFSDPGSPTYLIE